MKNKQGLGKQCLRRLLYGLTLGFFYTIFLGGTYTGLAPVPMEFIRVIWGITQLILAYGVFCIYQLSEDPKYVLATLLLAASSVFTLIPMIHLGFIALAVEALAVTALSLVLYDLGKARPESGLILVGGLIFLGVIFSILNQPTMEGLGILALLIGFLLGATRLMRL